MLINAAKLVSESKQPGALPRVCTPCMYVYSAGTRGSAEETRIATEIQRAREREGKKERVKDRERDKERQRGRGASHPSRESLNRMRRRSPPYARYSLAAIGKVLASVSVHSQFALARANYAKFMRTGDTGSAGTALA